MVPGRCVGMDGQNVSLSEIEKKREQGTVRYVMFNILFYYDAKEHSYYLYKKRTSFVAYERNVEPGPSKAADRTSVTVDCPRRRDRST